MIEEYIKKSIEQYYILNFKRKFKKQTEEMKKLIFAYIDR